ncbi:MAG: hypothetical protein ABSG65_07795, partial [Bryobacteraceae bacterium]
MSRMAEPPLQKLLPLIRQSAVFWLFELGGWLQAIAERSGLAEQGLFFPLRPPVFVFLRAP